MRTAGFEAQAVGVVAVDAVVGRCGAALLAAVPIGPLGACALHILMFILRQKQSAFFLRLRKPQSSHGDRTRKTLTSADSLVTSTVVLEAAGVGLAQQTENPVVSSGLHTPVQHDPAQKPVLPMGPAVTSSGLMLTK